MPQQTQAEPLTNSPLSLILILGLGFLMLGGGKGCDLNSIVPTPAPAVTTVVPLPATLALCSPIKAATASADPTKKARIASAFNDLATVLNLAGDNIKTTGTLSDAINTFSSVITSTEPDLTNAVSMNAQLTAARDAWINSLPGTGVDRPITKQQAADFVAAISASLR